MQNIFRVFMLMLVAALAACGGGGEASGVNPNQATLVTTAGSSLILPVGVARDYQINGGVPPYRISNSDQAIAVGQVNGNTLTIGAVAAGSVNISVLDYKGDSVTINVKVGSSTPLYTTAPGTLTIGVGADVARTFWIGGGAAPYTVEGGDSNVALVRPVGATQWQATGVAMGSTNVKIRDAAGAEVSISLMVGSPELRISPTDLSIPVGMEAVAKLSGGQPPYRIAGGIPAAITAFIQGDELYIKGSLASELELGVMDAAGKIVKVKVKVNTATTSIRLSPDALVVSENDTQDIQFTIFGAQGSTCVFTSDSSYLQVEPTASGCMNRKTLTLITGTRGSRCVNGNQEVVLTVVDDARSTATARVTIQDNGSNGSCGNFSVSRSEVPIQIGAEVDVLISGGSGRFDFATSNSAVATASLTGNKLTITGGATGSATITVRDQANTSRSVAISVTVTKADVSVTPAPMTAAPSAATGSVQEILRFVLQNGQGPYTVEVSNPSIAKIKNLVNGKVNGPVVETELVGAGQAILVVTDNRGQTLNIAVTATQTQQASLRFAPSAFEVGEDSLAPITLTVFGGTPPYRAVTSDLTLSSVAVRTDPVTNLTEFTVGLGTNLNRCIDPRAGSLYVIRGEVPVTLTVIDSGGSFATSVMTIRDNGTGLSPAFGGVGVCPIGAETSFTTTAGTATSVLEGSSRTYAITGGVTGLPGAAIFTVSSSDETVAKTAMVSQTSFSITGRKAGNATVTVRDAAAGTVTINVTVSK